MPEGIIDLIVCIRAIASAGAAAQREAILRLAPRHRSTELCTHEAVHTRSSLGIEGSLCAVLGDDVDSPRESTRTIDKCRGATKHLDTLDIREVDREIEA